MNRYFVHKNIFHYNFYCKYINKCIARILIAIAIRIVLRIKFAQHDLEINKISTHGGHGISQEVNKHRSLR